MEQLRTARFPEHFRFGVADADLQVMGERYCREEEGSEQSLWSDFARTSGKVFENQEPDVCVDRFHRWKEDIVLMKSLGVRHFRTSVSLCRTLHPDGSINEKAIAWYRRYFEELKREGFSLCITVFHWELPLWVHQCGGWKDRSIVDLLVRHALVIQGRLGEYIDEIFILNEPFQFTLLSYHLGEHAPGETDLASGLLAVHHALLAQGRVLRELRKHSPSIRIGTTYNARPFYAFSTGPQDLAAMKIARAYQTGIFIEPLYRGMYPEELQRVCAAAWPTVEKGDMDIIKIGAELDTFGLNYYRGMVIEADASPLGFREMQFPQGVKNGLGWPVYLQPTYPEGLYDLLRELWHRYGSFGMKQIYVTENGTCWDDKPNAKGVVDDDFRMFFLREHLQQILKAIIAGVPVDGYYLWTLMDNYEWDMGFKPGSSFGIVHVDRTTLERTPKKSFGWYRDVVARYSL